MKLILHEISVPLRHGFTTSHGTLEMKRNLLVELQDGEFSGWGEASPSLAYPDITVESIRASLEAQRTRIETYPWHQPTVFWAMLDPWLRHNRFAQCALDQAAHDLWGKRLGKPVWELWGLKLDRLPVSNYTIGIDTVERMVEKLIEFSDWPIFKIKLGTERDVEIVRELRSHTKATFRVDANTGWSVEQTLKFAPQLKELGVEFIEQPLPATDWDGMRRLMEECALPLIADESCQTEADIDRCVGHFHGVNVKLSKAGGLTTARRMLLRAKSLGLKTMAGCMIETTVGISAQAQLLPLLDVVDLDGSVLLAENVADGVIVERGVATFPATAGTGVANVRCH